MVYLPYHLLDSSTFLFHGTQFPMKQKKSHLIHQDTEPFLVLYEKAFYDFPSPLPCMPGRGAQSGPPFIRICAIVSARAFCCVNCGRVKAFRLHLLFACSVFWHFQESTNSFLCYIENNQHHDWWYFHFSSLPSLPCTSACCCLCSINMYVLLSHSIITTCSVPSWCSSIRRSQCCAGR